MKRSRRRSRWPACAASSSAAPLRVGGGVPSSGREGEDFEAILGDADAVLELRRKRAVARHRSPSVIQNLYRVAAKIDHRLDGEEHAGLQHDALPRPAV